MAKYKYEIEKTLAIYNYGTNIACRAMEVKGRHLIGHSDSSNTLGFCELVHSLFKGKEDCLKSHIYGARQAEKLGEEYIYFCPYGLINWAVPMMKGNEMKYFLIGGPTLIHPVDKFLLENIYKQNSLLENESKSIKKELNNIPYANPVRTRYLAELLMYLTVSHQNYLSLEERRKTNTINTHLAETIHELKNNYWSKDQLYPIAKENELILKVKLSDSEGARRVLNELLGYIYFNNGNNFSILKMRTIELMALLARAAIEVGADLEIIFGLEYMLYEKLNKVKDINELSETLTKILDRFIESTFIIKNAQNRDIIYKAINYIKNNYHNKNISLNDVANEIGLSPSYFSKLFKEELDLSYIEYLNKVRIEASKELLQKEHSLAEIAQSVGFSDQSYFSKVFKKIEGIPPGRWRK